MTKYILAGGNDLRFDTYGRRIANEVYGCMKKPVKLTSCFFATPSEFWDVKAETWRPWFERYFGEDIVWSFARQDNFIDQVRQSDVIYLHGGDNDLLHETLNQFPDLQSHFEGRIVIGSSAGANYLSQHFWRRRQQKIGRGMGIVPCNIMVHYGVDEDGVPKTNWEEVEAELAAFDGDEPLKLSEGCFKVIEL